ncbi:hypothetical protein DVR12_26740 [Chitinophaga silvatica]|uniref:Uncharacterized protein n=1 Tax=Chitinophaga silvatica TaxID=2282649 RepID=A0A3E1Y284_9BACT|nr:hypothetical protein [Chitinophaga silvatica]RFS18799.1 hypothetical protein DVR12_26740 [Chitinophaga silvatica]
MRREPLDQLKEFITKESISFPEIQFDGRKVQFTTSGLNSNSFWMLFGIGLSIALMIKYILLVGLILFGFGFYGLWYDLEVANNFVIDFDSKHCVLHRKNPFRVLFFFMRKEITFPISDIASFSYRSSRHSSDMRRYRFYVFLKDGTEYLFSDIKSEDHAREIVKYLNNAIWQKLSF